MDDLVKRLRAVSDFGTANGGTSLDGLWTEAADRIEALEAALREARAVLARLVAMDDAGMGVTGWDANFDAARAVLTAPPHPAPSPDAALRDAMLHGISFTMDGKHVPLSEFYKLGKAKPTDD